MAFGSISFQVSLMILPNPNGNQNAFIKIHEDHGNNSHLIILDANTQKITFRHYIGNVLDNQISTNYNICTNRIYTITIDCRKLSLGTPGANIWIKSVDGNLIGQNSDTTLTAFDFANVGLGYCVDPNITNSNPWFSVGTVGGAKATFFQEKLTILWKYQNNLKNSKK